MPNICTIFTPVRMVSDCILQCSYWINHLRSLIRETYACIQWWAKSASILWRIVQQTSRHWLRPTYYHILTLFDIVPIWYYVLDWSEMHKNIDGNLHLCNQRKNQNLNTSLSKPKTVNMQYQTPRLCAYVHVVQSREDRVVLTHPFQRCIES